MSSLTAAEQTSSQPITHIPDKSPGHQDDDKLLAAGFCQILLHGAAAIAAKDSPETQIKEAALVAATIVSLLQLASRTLPEEALRNPDHDAAVKDLEKMLHELVKNPKFLQTLNKQISIK